MLLCELDQIGKRDVHIFKFEKTSTICGTNALNLAIQDLIPGKASVLWSSDSSRNSNTAFY